jgi:hypothetical protein
MKLKGLSEEKCSELFSDGNGNPLNMILAGYRGSIAHGTYVPSTDPNSIVGSPYNNKKSISKRT